MFRSIIEFIDSWETFHGKQVILLFYSIKLGALKGFQ